jgi:hypothetical protein
MGFTLGLHVKHVVRAFLYQIMGCHVGNTGEVAQGPHLQGYIMTPILNVTMGVLPRKPFQMRWWLGIWNTSWTFKTRQGGLTRGHHQKTNRNSSIQCSFIKCSTNSKTTTCLIPPTCTPLPSSSIKYLSHFLDSFCPHKINWRCISICLHYDVYDFSFFPQNLKFTNHIQPNLCYLLFDAHNVRVLWTSINNLGDSTDHSN